MSTNEMDRREAIVAGAAAAAMATGLAGEAQAQPAGVQFQTRPLPFNPAAAPGFSERILRSHYDNNYTGAVRRLGAIEGQLAALAPDAPGFQLNGLKREELMAWNSMVLHEVHFASLGTPNQPAAPLAAAIERDFGGLQRWATVFSSAGKALGGGSGWVLLTWSPRDRRLVNTWAADHTMTLAGGTPLLALDMYEHAYHMDFGANAGAYVDAFMKAINWTAASAAFAAVSRG